MNHYNFFSSLSPEKKSTTGPLIAAALIGCSLVVVAGMYLNAKIKHNNVQQQLDYLTSVENNPVFIQRNNMNNALNKQLTSVSDNYLFLRTADLFTGLANTASDENVKMIFSFFPEGTKISRIAIDINSVSISGIADSLDSMIKVEEKMNASGFFSGVYIDSARVDGHTDVNGDDAVTFNCRLTLSDKGGETK